MKVRELIKELEKLDQESELKLMYNGFYLNIKKIISDGRIWLNRK